MDGGDWWATVHGVPKSRTRFSDKTTKQRSQAQTLPSSSPTLPATLSSHTDMEPLFSCSSRSWSLSQSWQVPSLQDSPCRKQGIVMNAEFLDSLSPLQARISILHFSTGVFWQLINCDLDVQLIESQNSVQRSSKKKAFLKNRKKKKEEEVRKRAKAFRTRSRLHSWHMRPQKHWAWPMSLTLPPTPWLWAPARGWWLNAKGESPCPVGFVQIWWQPQRRVDPSGRAGMTAVSQHDEDHSYTWTVLRGRQAVPFMVSSL